MCVGWGECGLVGPREDFAIPNQWNGPQHGRDRTELLARLPRIPCGMPQTYNSHIGLVLKSLSSVGKLPSAYIFFSSHSISRINARLSSIA